PRVLRTYLHAYACRIYVTALPARTGLCVYWPAYPAVPPLSASCSSGQRFACGFLQIPPRDEHPCRSANTSPCRVCRGLSPPSKCALPGAPRKSAGCVPALVLSDAFEIEAYNQNLEPGNGLLLFRSAGVAGLLIGVNLGWVLAPIAVLGFGGFSLCFLLGELFFLAGFLALLLGFLLCRAFFLSQVRTTLLGRH